MCLPGENQSFCRVLSENLRKVRLNGSGSAGVGVWRRWTPLKKFGCSGVLSGWDRQPGDSIMAARDGGNSPEAMPVPTLSDRKADRWRGCL